ncbi:hypothetical protein A9Q81_22555 [Gammaproteobacteria bacterium 42_54_T18]|nr:hypothetical protein A9Q81_22555 [Gammaproteobacteria bacterium 42_54_T18]
MVQVDVFWAYGLGASLAVAAGRQLTQEPNPFQSKYFVNTILFLALVWAPTGMLLLLRHPSWETMQAADTIYSISEWLILAFGLTNITQGMLGFWVSYKLISNGKYYYANLNWIFGYFGMFFILLYGWDGLGYDRFLYDRDMLSGSPAWTPGAGTTDGIIISLWNFMTSGVAITLIIDGVYLYPPFVAFMGLWYINGLNTDPLIKRKPGYTRCTISYVSGCFIVGFGGAAISAVTVAYVGAALGVGDNILRGLGEIDSNTSMHIASYIIGLPLSLAMMWFMLLRPGMLFHKLLAPWYVGEVEHSITKVYASKTLITE